MKLSITVIGCFAAGALALLAACKPTDTISDDTSCTECHSGDTTIGNAVLAAQAQYENSGHFNGPRTLDPNYDSTGHIYLFHGSNAMYTNGTPCSKCHTHQGFVEYVETGTVPDLAAASQPGCFTCHKPHLTGDFSMRKETSEKLVDGTSVFDYGKGNLCVTCHKAYSSATTFFAGTFPKSWRSSDGAHHGPQADFLMGKNFWAYGSNTYQGASIHLTHPASPDSCVSCHMFEPTSRLGGTLQLGGHGMYLTGDVHGSEKDIIQVCQICHNGTTASLYPASSSTFADNGHTAPADWDGDGMAEDKIVEIAGMSDTLVGYFSTDANFNSGAGPAPISVIGTLPGRWNRDWEFASAKLTLVQSQSFWNFKLFTEDHSGGIHNPTFAAQILYDAIDNLNDNIIPSPGLILGATRPR